MALASFIFLAGDAASPPFIDKLALASFLRCFIAAAVVASLLCGPFLLCCDTASQTNIAVNVVTLDVLTYLWVVQWTCLVHHFFEQEQFQMLLHALPVQL